MNAQFDLVVPALIIAVVALGAGVAARALARKVKSFLWASWRHIPYSPSRYRVGGDCHHREFVGRDQ